MSLFRRRQQQDPDLAMLISDRLRNQQAMMNNLKIHLANAHDSDEEELQLVKQQLNRITLEFEINQHRLGIVLKERELKSLSED